MISGSSKYGSSDQTKTAAASKPVSVMTTSSIAGREVALAESEDFTALRERQMEEPERWDGMS
jgi:hypothetical protein